MSSEIAPQYIWIAGLISSGIIVPLWGLVRWMFNRLDTSWSARLADKDKELERTNENWQARFNEMVAERDRAYNLYTQETGKNFSIMSNQERLIDMMEANLRFQTSALTIIDKNSAVISEVGTMIEHRVPPII